MIKTTEAMKTNGSFHINASSILLLLAPIHLVRAQETDEARYEIHPASTVPTVVQENVGNVSPVHGTTPAFRFNPADPGPANGGNYSLQFLGGINPKNPGLDSIKQLKNAATEEAEQMGTQWEEAGAAKASTPGIGYSFDSNTQYSSTPMDNSVAISDNDVIVAASNGGVQMHRYDGTLLGSFDWTQFAGEPCFDPHVFYDAEDNRFVMVALHGNTPSTSRLKIMFSSSMDPLQPWNVYSIATSDLSSYIGSGKWLDYPTLGLSDDEVFVSVDVRNSNDFVESVVFQLDHSDGYAGNTMNWVIWHGISNSPFAAYHLTAAPNGWSGRFTNGQYFVASSWSGGNSVRVLRITAPIGEDPVMNSSTVGTSAYSVPADAHMPGTSKRLDIGSCSVRGAYYLNGYLHMVFSTENSDGIGKIRYVRVATSGMTAQSSTFYGTAENYFAYPTVVPYNNTDNGGANKNAIIGFLASNNTNKYPSISVVNCDNNMDWSGSLNIKSGSTYIEYTSSTSQRWGDYIGMCREHSTPDEPRVWIAGAYAVSGHVYRARIAQVGLGSITSLEEKESMAPFTGSALYPNPTEGPVTFDFIYADDAPLDIQLITTNGAVVETLYQGIPRSGKNRITFDTEHLAPGIYMLTARSNGAILGAQRLIAQ